MGAYVDEADYMALTDGSQPYDAQRILQAEDEVNDLCFGRIAAIGFEHLTEFQRRRVQKAVCLHAVFLAQYADMLQSPLASYGINGVSIKKGCTTAVHQETSVNQAMIENSSGKVIVVADHSKMNCVSSFLTCPLSRIDMIVTDWQAPASFCQELEEAGVRVVQVEEEAV